MNQIELLLRLSENAQDKGDEIAGRHHQERAAHAKELTDLHRMIEVARQNVEAEMDRWGYRGPKATALGQVQTNPTQQKDVNLVPKTTPGGNSDIRAVGTSGQSR